MLGRPPHSRDVLERLFAVFDKNASNTISFNEFVGGLAILCRSLFYLKLILRLTTISEAHGMKK
jgi:hypothetical protein